MTWLYIVYIVICALLITFVCLQKSVGQATGKTPKKLFTGIEKTLFNGTIILAIACAVLAILMYRN